MPTILIHEGFRLFFYSADGIEPMHIHVEYGNGLAKFWISPNQLVYSHGLKAQELRRARKIIDIHEELIKEKWHEYFGI